MSMQNQNKKNASKSIEIVASREGQPFLCPKCHDPLFVGFDHDVEVDICQKCKGLWVDVIREKDLLEMKPEVFTIDELKRLRKLYQPLPRSEKSSGYVPCPVCRILMWRRNWGSYSGVIVDRCEAHGTWYDDQEVEKLREFVKLGGIEYEKYFSAATAISEVDMKLMRKAHELDMRIDSAYQRARYYSLLGF